MQSEAQEIERSQGLTLRFAQEVEQFEQIED